MDLISKKAAVSRISDSLILELKGERIPAWNEVYNAIGDIPSVPAVPLDKLCEWLGKAAILRCYECTSKCCDGEKCSSSNHFYKEIKKWMEEQDATDRR